LIHVSGRALARDALSDPNFPFINVKALVLQRNVEMFQWEEYQQTKETTEIGGSVTTETTYTYRKAWSGALNDSSHFHDHRNHENPTRLPYASLAIKAEDASLGAFKLPYDMLSLYATDTLSMPEDVTENNNYKIAEGQIYIGDNPETPTIGDVRIHYLYAPEQDISIVAQQQGGSFGPFSVSNNRGSIQMLSPGLLDAQDMFSAAQSENATATWLLRGLGVLGLFMGFYLILRPLIVLGDVVPLAGRVLDAGATLLAACLSIFCGLLIIALAWLYYRPFIGVSLLLIAGAAMVGMFSMIRKSAKRKAAASRAA
jgi:hypothetical protein